MAHNTCGSVPVCSWRAMHVAMLLRRQRARGVQALQRKQRENDLHGERATVHKIACHAA